MVADGLARAGVGYLRIIERDVVELHNLQRQVLFDETDMTAGLPKAVAAANKLARINSEVQVEPVATDLSPRNAERLLDGVDLVILVDVWEGTWEMLFPRKGDGRCPTCDERRFDFLVAREVDRVVELCGENAFSDHPARGRMYPAGAPGEAEAKVVYAKYVGA